MMEFNLIGNKAGIYSYPIYNGKSLLVLWNQGMLYSGKDLNSNRSLIPCKGYEIAIPSNSVLFELTPLPERKNAAFTDAVTIREAHMWLSYKIGKSIDELSFRNFFVKEYPWRYRKMLDIAKRIDSVRRTNNEKVILGAGVINVRIGHGVMEFPGLNIDMDILGWKKRFSRNSFDQIKFSHPKVKAVEINHYYDDGKDRLYKIRAVIPKSIWFNLKE